MIKALQRKFILLTMISLFLVMSLIIGVIHAVNLVQVDQQAEMLLDILSENGGNFPKQNFHGGESKDWNKPKRKEFGMSAETPFETRYFTVLADGAGSIVQIDTGHIAAITSSDAEEYARTILETGKQSGYYGDYKYRLTEQGNGQLLIFVDCGVRLHAANSFLGVSLLVGFGALLMVLLLVSLLSRRIVRPVMESMEKQRQFITDAGHEIKTPLAIISANTEVLEMTEGSNEWTQSIRNQVGRLGDLVQNLLALSRLEEQQNALQKTDFSLSDAVSETAEPFAVLAETKGKAVSFFVEYGISYHGDEQTLRRLVSILMENAVKYAPEGGIITLRLEQKGKNIKLQVHNPCEQMPTGDLERLFDRFYRADEARTQASGGYGIGLSIAQAIVSAHHGKITAGATKSGELSFTVQL